MSRHLYFHVDAFTDRAFGGGPAAVFVSNDEIDPITARTIAAEFGQSVAVFLRPGDNVCEARFFTADREVGFVGHASQAAAFVYLQHVRTDVNEAEFTSPIGGTLRISRCDERRVAIELTAMPGVLVDDIHGASAALPKLFISERLRAEFGPVIVLAKEADILAAAPDMSLVKQIEGSAFILTAPGEEVDFVSRVFAPKLGLEEDPVCGTAHRILVPYWANRLGRTKLTARQISWRGGIFECEWRKDGVRLSGSCVCLIKGELET